MTSIGKLRSMFFNELDLVVAEYSSKSAALELEHEANQKKLFEDYTHKLKVLGEKFDQVIEQLRKDLDVTIPGIDMFFQDR